MRAHLVEETPLQCLLICSSSNENIRLMMQTLRRVQGLWEILQTEKSFTSCKHSATPCCSAEGHWLILTNESALRAQSVSEVFIVKQLQERSISAHPVPVVPQSEAVIGSVACRRLLVSH